MTCLHARVHACMRVQNELVTHVVKEYCRDSLPGQALAGQPATQIGLQSLQATCAQHRHHHCHHHLSSPPCTIHRRHDPSMHRPACQRPAWRRRRCRTAFCSWCWLVIARPTPCTAHQDAFCDALMPALDRYGNSAMGPEFIFSSNEIRTLLRNHGQLSMIMLRDWRRARRGAEAAACGW